MILLPPFPDNARDYIEAMIDMIGRQVEFVSIASLSGCDLCSLDPTTNTSVDSFCPLCSGDYWIPIYSGTQLTAHVTYGRVDNSSWQTGGIVDDGTVTVKVMWSGADVSLAALPDYMANPEWVIVDGKEYDIVDKNFRGVQPLNRILFRLKEKEG